MKTFCKTITGIIRIIPAFLIVLCLSMVNSVIGQVSYQAVGPIKISIEGTSNIHDWEMKGSQGTGAATFVVDGSGKLNELSSLTFSMPAQSLKSEHSGMDKNAYKAMRTDKYPTISFTAASTTIRPAGNSYQVTSRGKLTISSVSRDIDITAVCTVNPDKTISCTGSYKMKMTSYNVTPPSIMFGAIKTGDDITVKFNLLFKAR